MANRLPVVFEDAQGNIISNDPVYNAMKTLFNAGQGDDPDIAIRKAQKAEAKNAGKPTPEPEEDDSDDTFDEDEVEDYKSIKGQALADLAKSRGVELTKGITAGAIRDALVAQDAAKSDDESDEEDDSNDDDNQE